MRSLWTALFVVVLVTGGMPQKTRRTKPSEGPQPSRQAEDQAAIRKLQEKDIAANVGFDTDALLSLWSDDAVLLAPGQAPISGKPALRKFYEQQQQALSNVEILSYDEQWQEVRIMGDYAYQWGQIHSRTRSGQGNAENTSVVNVMRILKRESEGTWEIARAIYNEARSGTSVGSEPARKENDSER